MFDCLIIALPAKEYDLSWLIPIIIMTNKEEPVVSGEVKMMYTVPELPVTDTITVKFQSADLRKILLAYVYTVLIYLIIQKHYKRLFVIYTLYHTYTYIFIKYYLLICRIITNQNDDNIILDRNHIEIFFEVLHKQMLIIGGLELRLCTLHRIDLPGITITENKVSLCIYI